MLGYVECIGKYFPTVFVHCTGTAINGTMLEKYESLIHDGGDYIPSKAVLDDFIFEDLKITAIDNLSTICQDAIRGGFFSSALGSRHIYDSDEVDQLNLIGATTSTLPTPTEPDGGLMYYAVREVIDNITQPKDYKPHTHTQFRQVMADGAAYKLALLMNFNYKRYFISNATTPEEVLAITWSSNP